MGFEVDRFSQQPPPEFICFICTSVLDDPVQCSNHHIFCRGCISQWLTTLNDGTGELNASCPACRSEMSVQRLKEGPRNLKQRLNKLKIFCSHPNCDSVTVDLENILKHEDQCNFQREKIFCIFGCGEFHYSEEEMENHLQGCNRYVDFLLELDNDVEPDSSANSSHDNSRDQDWLRRIIPDDRNDEEEVVERNYHAARLEYEAAMAQQSNAPAAPVRQRQSRCRKSTVLSIMLASVAFMAFLVYLLYQFGKDILKSLHIM